MSEAWSSRLAVLGASIALLGAVSAFWFVCEGFITTVWPTLDLFGKKLVVSAGLVGCGIIIATLGISFAPRKYPTYPKPSEFKIVKDEDIK